jgi:hypothetical protein
MAKGNPPDSITPELALMAIQEASAVDAAVKKVGRVQAMADRIDAELNCRLPRKENAQQAAWREGSSHRNAKTRQPNFAGVEK